MANVFDNVRLTVLDDNGAVKTTHDTPLKIELCRARDKAHISLMNGGSELESVPLSKDVEVVGMGKSSVVVGGEENAYVLKFLSNTDAKKFRKDLEVLVEKLKKSVFNLRTDPASAEQYFQFYGYLSQQQNMMQDYIRTSTYQRAMLDNCADFKDKVVLDVGAGSGILSFFAHQAGAKKVYAVEASTMAMHCASLVDHNKLQDSIIVMPGKIEEVELPEKVDIIISEPMGYMLFNERMLETFLHAKKWLKPQGRMFPTQGDLHIAPFTDDSLYMEQFSKANFWCQQTFHGVDLSSLRQAAVNEYFKQPVVDTFDIRICMARPHKYTVDFQTADETELHNIEIPVSFTITQAGTVHGLAFWFDVAFIGSQATVWLSTSPTQPLTHWYQVRCLLPNPVFVKQGQTLTGKVNLRCNSRQSYDVDIELTVPGMSSRSANILDLKNPFFRYTGQAPQPPPGNNHTSPTDAYWNQTDNSCTVGQVAAVHGNYGVGALLNGAVAGLADVSQQAQYANLIPLANIAAPINPGSIPTATVVSLSQALQTRTSIGGGLSPSAFQQGVTISSATNSYPISNQFMIGDYAIPGNMVLPTQGLNLNKSG